MSAGEEGKVGRQAQVTEQLILCQNEVEILAKSISDLVERLKPVLSSLEIEKKKDVAKDEELVPVADAIRDLRKKIQHQSERLNCLEKRIEV